MHRFGSILAVLAIVLLGSLVFAATSQAEEFAFKSAGSSRVLAGISTPPFQVFFETTTTGRGGLGSFVADAHVQLVFGGPPGQCEPDEVPAQIVDIQTTTTYADLSQIVAHGSGTQCLTASGSLYGSVTGDIVFGTGRFEGRTGTLQATFMGQSSGIMNQIAIEGTITLD